MKISDSDVNDLKFEEHRLIRAFDKKEITESEFEEKVQPLRLKIMERVKLLIEKFNNNQPTEVESKMAEKVKEEKVPKIRSKTNSLASAVAEVLMRKTVKNVDAAVAELKKTHPGEKDSALKAKIGTIIRETKLGKGRWRNYTWDDSSYQLTSKL